jgi:hypothetical protein
MGKICKKVGKPTTPSLYIDEDLQKSRETYYPFSLHR